MLFFGGLIGAHVPEWTAEDNLKFLKDHMGVTMEERKIQRYKLFVLAYSYVFRVDIDKSQVKSGDFLGVMRLDGLDPMLAWAMGSHTGHTTIALWIDGELYVCESTIKSKYWPTNGVQKTPWDQWLDQAEKASYNVRCFETMAHACRLSICLSVPMWPNVSTLPLPSNFSILSRDCLTGSITSLPVGLTPTKTTSPET